MLKKLEKTIKNIKPGKKPDKNIEKLQKDLKE